MFTIPAIQHSPDLWLSGGCVSYDLYPVQKHFVTLSGLLIIYAHRFIW